MKRYICLLVGMALLAACEQKETTVNPPAEKKESNTTVVNPPTQKKESNTTVINPSQNQSPSTTKEKTEININSSPSPH
ncbi:MAG TPA: membrane lipoprotein lipid attachment site-containing protein [Candidatus Udaeobacter sp.]|nr:membrane lipoprotein lipid attachment site-containing protein [Candidatus Udaeobacter sp.]